MLRDEAAMAGHAPVLPEERERDREVREREETGEGDVKGIRFHRAVRDAATCIFFTCIFFLIIIIHLFWLRTCIFFSCHSQA